MMPAVRTGPAVGLAGQVVLVAALARTVGLGVGGWLAGVVYGLVTCAALSRALHRSGQAALGPADRVTLTRVVLVGGVAALTVDSFARPAPVGVLVALATVALVLDAVDGRVARGTGTASEFGARFDMEVDAFLILVLSVYAAPSAGGWVLAVGAMRYAYGAAAWMLPWLRGSLPPRHWRKVVAAAQGIVLVVAAAGVLPRPLLSAVLVVALALLTESFGRDVCWLWSHRRAEAGPWVDEAGLVRDAIDRLLAEEPERPTPSPPKFAFDPAVVDRADEHLAAGFGRAGLVEGEWLPPLTRDRISADGSLGGPRSVVSSVR